FKIIDEIIAALDIVGQNYENGRLFLPGLLMSADAARAGFEIIRSEIKQTDISKGKIILATVRGDIHDIGKNIVKAILLNYGYEIIDLGKDVNAGTILDRAIKDKVSLIGLSALMTTTVKSMEEIIKEIKKSKHKCKIMVGGAVLTPEYSKKIGADYYAKDASAAVKIAKKVLLN
ncbi:MAG: cobalamin-dependent protein, partial [Firmicutes bacterium]|nr:cobalamin-dependent protein [Bacillota bacterium]